MPKKDSDKSLTKLSRHYPGFIILKIEAEEKGYKLPFYISSVKAGFPSPADDYVEKSLDLNEFLIKRPAATYFVKAAGNSMKEVGIFDNDLLIVDRSIKPTHGKIIIAAINGELAVKRLHLSSSGNFLLSESSDYAPILITNEGVYIWGVVIHAIKSF